MSTKIRVLVVEDSESDAALVIRMLQQGGYATTHERVETAEDMAAALAHRAWDIVLADYSMPRFDAPHALKVLQDQKLDIPLIVVSGSIGEDTAVQLMKAGANDYVLKDKPARLVSAVERELREAEIRREKRKSEEALRESEEQYRSLFENMLNGFSLCKMEYKDGHPVDFTYISVNQAFEKLTGLKNVAGKKVSEVIPGIQETDKEVIELYSRVASTGNPASFEIYIKALNMWFSISAYSPRRDYFVAVFDVITERKRAEAALLESQERYRAMTSTATEGFWVVDPTGRLLEVNDAYCAMSGYSRKQLLGMCISDLEYVETPEKTQEHLDQVQSVGWSRFESQHRRADGSLLDVEVNVAALPSRNYLVSFLTDITKRKAAEQALADEAIRRRILIEQSRDGIVVLDTHGKVFEANQSYADMLGYSAEEVRHLYVWDWDAQWDREQLLAMIDAVDAEGAYFETQHRRKDGSLLDVEISSNAAIFGGRKLVFCVSRDITERRQAAASLLKSHRDLVEAHEQLKLQQRQLVMSEKLASLGQLAAGVAHEINNPIAYIKSNLGTLKDYLRVFNELIVSSQQLAACAETADDDGVARARARLAQLEQSEDIAYILKDVDDLIAESITGTERVRDIVQDLRIYAHSGEEASVESDVNRIIESSIRIAWNELKYKCELVQDLQPLPKLRCYPDRLHQVFVNMLVNGAQAIEEHGTIEISTQATDQGIIVRIADTGQGISPEVISKIFDPFFTTKTVGQGTGLGLAISYNTIQNHGGTIEVKSELGKGTEFIISLPFGGVHA